MTFDEFWTMYIRITYHLYDDEQWLKVSKFIDWLQAAKSITKFQAQELYMALLNTGALKGEFDFGDNTCEFCKTSKVCNLRKYSIGGYPRKSCASFECK